MSDKKSRSDSSFKTTRQDDAWVTKFEQEGKHTKTTVKTTIKDDGTESHAVGTELDVGKRLKKPRVRSCILPVEKQNAIPDSRIGRVDPPYDIGARNQVHANK